MKHHKITKIFIRVMLIAFCISTGFAKDLAANDTFQIATKSSTTKKYNHSINHLSDVGKAERKPFNTHKNEVDFPGNSKAKVKVNPRKLDTNAPAV